MSVKWSRLIGFHDNVFNSKTLHLSQFQYCRQKLSPSVKLKLCLFFCCVHSYLWQTAFIIQIISVISDKVNNNNNNKKTNEQNEQGFCRLDWINICEFEKTARDCRLKNLIHFQSMNSLKLFSAFAKLLQNEWLMVKLMPYTFWKYSVMIHWRYDKERWFNG